MMRWMLLWLAVGAMALDNGVGNRPPMGFNPWNCFGIAATGKCKLPLPWSGGCHGFNESVILQVARALKSTKLADAGYRYVNLDCGYSTGFRDANHSLVTNSTLFPHGMHWLGSELHSLGLKFGIYSDAGKTQCCSRQYGPDANDGSLGHEMADARLFASWGVDYLKHDDCGSQASSYPAMRDALNSTGRAIYYSVHGPTLDKGPGKLPGARVANCWRTTSDISNTWDSILQRALLNDQAAEQAAPGGFNDPDMLEVGNLWGAFGEAESRSHFSMWAVMKAPLLIGTDVTNMTEATLSVLGNADVIAVNQDALGVQARIVEHSERQLSWAGRLEDGAVVLAVNLGNATADLVLDLSWVPSAAERYEVYDLWAHRVIWSNVSAGAQLRVQGVGAHDCAMLKLTSSALRPE